MFSVPEIVRHYRRGTKALPADSGGIKRVWGYDNGGKGSMVGGLSHFDAAGNGGNDSKVLRPEIIVADDLIIRFLPRKCRLLFLLYRR